MAIQISGTTVIDNTRNLVNTQNGNFAGIVTATQFIGNGIDLQKRNIGMIYTLGQ
jgi:hypothetical protein